MRPKRSKAEHNNLLTPHLNPIGSRPFTSPDLVLLYIPDSLCVLSYQDTDDGDTVGLRNVGRLKKKKLRWLSAQEDTIAFFRRKNFRTSIKHYIVLHRYEIFQIHTLLFCASLFLF